MQDYLAKRSLNFNNLSDITAVNLYFGWNDTFAQPKDQVEVFACLRAGGPPLRKNVELTTLFTKSF
jgi:hypothetical protein